MTETHRGVLGPNTLYVIVFITQKFHFEAISRHGDNDPEREVRSRRVEKVVMVASNRSFIF